MIVQLVATFYVCVIVVIAENGACPFNFTKIDENRPKK